MKKQVSPAVMVAAIVLVLALVGFFFWRGMQPSEQPAANSHPKDMGGRPGIGGGGKMAAPSGKSGPNSPDG